MYVIHRTPGLILTSFVHGEADRRYVILTEMFGRVEAKAKSVRLEKSRLRYGLSQYALGMYALVRGKSGWHIVGSRDEENYFARLRTMEERKALERISSLLARLVVAEGKHESLFQTAVAGINALTQYDASYTEAVEHLTVLRILFLLGYISTEQTHDVLKHFVQDTSYAEHILELVKENKKIIIYAINKALTASHL